MKVLLYSGGTDSWLINRIWNPDVLLYVDMKTQYSDSEMSVLSYSLSEKERKKLKFAELPLGRYENKETAFIPGRNMFLLMIACNYGDEICFGSVADDAGGCSDTDIGFAQEAEHMLNRLWGKKITVEKKFFSYSKDDLIHEYLSKGGSIEEFKDKTFSCYSPTLFEEECLNCKACFRKFIACYGNGACYSRRELESMYDFIEKDVVHKSHHAEGRYFLDKPNGQQILGVIQKLYKELDRELDLT